MIFNEGFFMKIASSTRKSVSQALLISSIFLLPACKPLDWFKDTSGSDKPHVGREEVVVTFNGKTMVSGSDFEKNIELLIQAQPIFQQMLPSMPAEQQAQIYNQIAETMAAERMMIEDVKRKGLDKTAEYKNNARQIHDAVDRDLAVRAFQNELIKEISITDAQAEQFYNENRDKNAAFKRPPFTAMAGGVNARGITFPTEQAAKDFLAQAKKSDFTAAAQQANKPITDLTNAVDPKIKSAVTGMKKFPALEVVKSSDNKFWVVEGKQDGQLAGFAQIKDAVKEVMMGEKFNEVYSKKMADLKSELNVVVNKDYIANRTAKTAPQEVSDDMAQEPAPAPKTKQVA